MYVHSRLHHSEEAIVLKSTATLWGMRCPGPLEKGCSYKVIHQTMRCSKRKVSQVVNAIRITGKVGKFS
jgi:hypothetical protein